jgi:hypothetical protein
MKKLTKRQIKLLSEMWSFRFNENGIAFEHDGKYYFGGKEMGEKPTGTATLNELVELELVTFTKGNYGDYRLSINKDDKSFHAAKYFDSKGVFIQAD